ncbi:MAG: type II toxin-antitoxin system VapC family toxin [Candidatus Brocadiaceae bacterium]
MPGYLLDTNSVIYFFNGEEKISKIIEDAEDFICISFITKIELLCFETDDTEIIKEITKFIEVVEVLFINDAIISKAIEYRKNIKLKIPDSIIVATAQVMRLTLVSADKSLIQKLKDVKVISPI